MKAEHITTWTDDETDVSWSVYRTPDFENLDYYLKVGPMVMKLTNKQLSTATDLLIEVAKDIREDLTI